MHLYFIEFFSDLFIYFPLPQVSKESAGAVDEEDFIKAFTDVPAVQVQCPHNAIKHIYLSNNLLITAFKDQIVTDVLLHCVADLLNKRS